MNNNTNYHFFMQKALAQAKKALSAGEFPVGCVMVYQEEILVTGSRMGTVGNCPNETDHAEMVALRRLYDLFKNIDRSKITLFCTLEPCLMCYGALLLSGIREIVYAYEDVMGGGTRCDLSTLAPLYKNCPIIITSDILRHESVALLKDYFTNPENTYWGQSLLAEYTLNQD
ncbi:nucleoside deaminase [Thermodesulfobacteriota bacterium]